MEKNNLPFDSLCLQGMSTKALMALGGIQFLQDSDRLSGVDKFLGTSSGAVVSFFLIIGYTPAELLSYICVHKVLEKLTHFNMVAMVNGGGAKSWSKIQETLEKMTIQKIGYLPTMKCLVDKFKKQLTVVTYNVSKNKVEYICAKTHPAMPVLIALHMTANLPFVFEKFQYQKSYYIDGGVANNFPLKLAEKTGKRVIGIRVNNPPVDDSDKETFMAYMYRILMVPISEVERVQISERRKNTCVQTLTTSKTVRAFDFKFSNTDKMDMFSDGYQQMKQLFSDDGGKSASFSAAKCAALAAAAASAAAATAALAIEAAVEENKKEFKKETS